MGEDQAGSEYEGREENSSDEEEEEQTQKKKGRSRSGSKDEVCACVYVCVCPLRLPFHIICQCLYVINTDRPANTKRLV